MLEFAPMSESAIGRLLERIIDPLIGFGWRVYGLAFCKHDWRKDIVTTRASDHPLVRDKKMWGHYFCANCGRKKWSMNFETKR